MTPAGSSAPALPRLRQAVVAAVDLEATMDAFERELGVTAPHHDPGLATYGLRNAVYILGDTFLEIVSPIEAVTAAGRQIERAGGDCGYMCMFELADETAVRRRVDQVGARIVHDGRHDDIVDLHLHPKDVPGAIVALDVCRPPRSWRWAGAAWTGTVPAVVGPGGLRGMTVAVRDPDAAAATWGALLGVEPAGTTLTLQDGEQNLHFVAADSAVERIVEVRLGVPEGAGTVTIAGVRFVRTRD